MKKRVMVKISGRVQGVLFRDSARRRARRLGLTGFVKNEPDGSVYIEAEGEEEKLTAFLAWCGKGPPFASVKNIEIFPSDENKNFPDFVIQ